MNDFEAHTLTGLCYRKQGRFYLQEHKRDCDLSGLLESLEGRELSYAFHHYPTHPDEDRWGLGSCKWQPSRCPAGHHADPRSMLAVSGEGTLQSEGGAFQMHGCEGARTRVPLRMMEGHECRVVLVTVFDPQAQPKGAPEDMSGLLERVQEARDMMKRVEELLGETS